MFDKIITKLVKENLLPLQELSQQRLGELEYVKSKIFTNPEEVERWFNKEINKINNIDIDSSLHKIIKNNHQESL